MLTAKETSTTKKGKAITSFENSSIKALFKYATNKPNHLL